ncbi:unnamed protein product, partial [Prunus brigantina]
MPTNRNVKAQNAPRTRGASTVNIHSPTSKFYITCTPPKVYKRSTITQNGASESLRPIPHRCARSYRADPYFAGSCSTEAQEHSK